MSRAKGKSVMNPKWTPFELSDSFRTPDGKIHPIDTLAIKWYRNSKYQVIMRRLPESPVFGTIYHLSVKRNDRLPIREWRDLQRIKNELVSPEAEAIELFPAESRKVDTANQYHLWVFADFKFGTLEIGDGVREVTPPNRATNVGARQEPFDPSDPYGPDVP